MATIDPGTTLSGIADAGALLKSVIDDIPKGNYFPLGVEIENITQFDLTISPGYPFLPHPGNMDGDIQCGQTAFSQPSVVGPDSPPHRIYSPSNSASKAVGSFDGYGVGTDSNIGCISYQAVDSNEDPLFTFVLGWFMGGTNLVQYAFAANTDGTAYDNEGKTLFQNKTSGFSALDCNFTHYWTNASQKEKINMTINSKSETFQFTISPGGSVTKYQIVIEVKQIGYNPPS